MASGHVFTSNYAFEAVGSAQIALGFRQLQDPGRETTTHSLDYTGDRARGQQKGRQLRDKQLTPLVIPTPRLCF